MGSIQDRVIPKGTSYFLSKRSAYKDSSGTFLHSSFDNSDMDSIWNDQWINLININYNTVKLFHN